jgi:hypothetical protein
VWRGLFLGREGLYVATRFITLLASLGIVGMTSWQIPFHVVLRIFAILLALLLAGDIVLAHIAIVFVSQKPTNDLRSALLALFSFVQITVAFVRSLNSVVVFL